jgi:hypothetical protein
VSSYSQVNTVVSQCTVEVCLLGISGPDLFWINGISGVHIYYLQKSTIIEKDFFCTKVW